MENKKGLTIAELLIVVAIIGVLVAVSIPIFTAQLEKSRRAVDIANARSVEAALATMINDGTVDLSTGDGAKGIWVIVAKEGKSPTKYAGKTFFVGADQNVTINGKKKNSAWDTEATELRETISKCFGSDGVKVYNSGVATKVDGIGGWDWFAVEYTYDENQVSGKIYSGTAGGNADVTKVTSATNIEQWMYR